MLISPTDPEFDSRVYAALPEGARVALELKPWIVIVANESSRVVPPGQSHFGRSSGLVNRSEILSTSNILTQSRTRLRTPTISAARPIQDWRFERDCEGVKYSPVSNGSSAQVLSFGLTQ